MFPFNCSGEGFFLGCGVTRGWGSWLVSYYSIRDTCVKKEKNEENAIKKKLSVGDDVGAR